MEPADPQIETGAKKVEQPPEKTPEQLVTQAFNRWEMEKLRKCSERLSNEDIELAEVKGQHVIMFMGNTGAGKSTIVTALTTGRENIEITEDETYDAIKPLYYDCPDPATGGQKTHSKRMFEIGHKTIGQTTTPGFYPAPVKCDDGKTFYYIDCPGFSDNNRDKEFPNRTVVHKVMMEAETVKICLVINYNELIARKGEYAFEVITTISRLFQDYENAQNVIIPLINQTSMMNPKSAILDHLFERTIEFIELKQELYARKNKGERLSFRDEDILDQFSGVDFPSEWEMEHMKKFLRFIIKNYIVIDPQDYKCGIEDKEIPMIELAKLLTSSKGESPHKVSNADIPLKLGNFVLDEIVLKLVTDRLFPVPLVRETCTKYFQHVLGPWNQTKDKSTSKVTGAVMRIFGNYCHMEEMKAKHKFFKWYVEVFDDYFNDMIIHECDRINNFRAARHEKHLPLYNFFLDFYTEYKICLAVDLAEIDWSHFVWFLDWMEAFPEQEEIFDEDDGPKWHSMVSRKPPADYVGEAWKDKSTGTIQKCQPLLREFVRSETDKDIQRAYASTLGIAINRWLKTAWPECHKRTFQTILIEDMVADGFEDRRVRRIEIAKQKAEKAKKEAEEKAKGGAEPEKKD